MGHWSLWGVILHPWYPIDIVLFSIFGLFDVTLCDQKFLQKVNKSTPYIFFTDSELLPGTLCGRGQTWGVVSKCSFTSTEKLNFIIIFYKYFLPWLITWLPVLLGRERWRWKGLLLLRCACGPKWKPIKVRFMFIKCLSKLKNFLINSNLAAAPSMAGSTTSAAAAICLLQL